MRIVAILKNNEHPEYGEVSIPLPIKTTEYGRSMDLLSSLGIGDALRKDCQVAEFTRAYPTLRCLEGCKVNIDELDYGGALESYLKDYPHIKQIGLCLDVDEPGRVAAEHLRAQYEAAGCTVKILTPPKGKDWNEYLQLRAQGKERGDRRQTMSR